CCWFALPFRHGQQTHEGKGARALRASRDTEDRRFDQLTAGWSQRIFGNQLEWSWRLPVGWLVATSGSVTRCPSSAMGAAGSSAKGFSLGWAIPLKLAPSSTDND